MGFVELDGLTIPTFKGGEVAEVEVGTTQRAHDGTLLRSRRALKREWAFVTTPQQASTVEMIRSILLGRGYHFPYDSDLYSVGGLDTSTDLDSSFVSNTSAGGGTVANIYTAPSTEATAAARSGAVSCFPASSNVLTSDEADAEGSHPGTYTALGTPATLSAETTLRWQGSQSVKAVTTAANDGLETALRGAFGTGNKVTGSAYIYTDASTSLRISVIDSAAGSTAATFSPDSTGWHRIWVTHTLTGASTTAKVRIDQITAGAKTWYADGLQLEELAIVTAWLDGGTSRSASTKIIYGSNLMGQLARANGFTASCWVNGSDKPAQLSQFGHIISARLTADDDNQHYVLFYESTLGRIKATSIQTGGNVDIQGTVTDSYGPWHHYVLTVDFTEPRMYLYRDGTLIGSAVVQAPDLTDLDNAALAVGARMDVGATIQNDKSTGAEIDGVDILPYYVTSDWVTARYNSGTSRDISLPSMILTGDCTQDPDGVRVLGVVRRTAFVGIHRSGTWEPNNGQIQFNLREV